MTMVRAAEAGRVIVWNSKTQRAVKARYRHFDEYISSGFDGAEAIVREQTYITSPFKVAHNACYHHENARGNIIWGCRLQADHDIITNRGAMPPLNNVGAKAVVCEALCGVKKCVLR